MGKTTTHPKPTEGPALVEDLARAVSALAAKRPGEAAGICEDILAHQRDHPPALALLGRILGLRGQLDRGLALVEKAVALEPHTATYQQLLCNLYRLTYRFDDAVAAARRAVALDQKNPHIMFDLAKCLIDRLDDEEALTALLATLTRDASNAEAHLAIGQILLARGEMKPGWAEYEWRNCMAMAKDRFPKIIAPIWNGMHLADRRLLLISDQGFGDTIQFARYIPMAADRCGGIAFACPSSLIGLMRGIPGIEQIESRWDRMPPHACHILLSSLPMIFGTELDTIPARIPYLGADPGDVAAWKERFDAILLAGRRRVGLVWAGRATHPNDRRRSMRLADLAPLAAIGKVAFVSLQKPARALDRLDIFPGLVDIATDLTDFAQTAAALMNLDLVITIDSAVAHLAGALGRPAWVLLPRPCDWRWMHEREDTPWYPSLRLFRQARPGDWAEVVDRVLAALRAVPERSLVG